MKKPKHFRQFLYLWSSVLFIAYLAMIPTIVASLTPCMRSTFGSSYSYERCNTVLALDRFVSFAIGGAGVLLITSFFRDANRTYRRLLLTALIFSLSSINAYYLYAPRAERAIKRAPILFESLR